MTTYQKYVSILAFLMMSMAVQAQVSLGFKVGRSASNVTLNGTGNVLNTQNISHYNIGAVAEIELQNGFAFQPELNLRKQGFRVREGLDVNVLNIPIPLGVEAHTELKYVEIPLLGKYKFGQENMGGYVLAGPYAAYARQATLRTRANVIIDFNLTKTDIDLSNDNYNQWEAGAMGGVGFWAKAGNGQFFVDARYQHSLSDFFNDPIVDITMQNNGFGVNAGYLFAF